MSVLIPTDFCHGWAIFGPLADKNTWKGVLLELPASEKFSRHLLYMLWDISLKLGIYIWWVVSHVKFEFNSNLDTLTYLAAKIGQSHLSAFMALKVMQRLHFWYTHSNSECLDPCWFLSSLGNFWPSGGQKHSKGGVSRAPSQRHMRFEFHQNQVSASEEFSGLFSKCFAISTWKLVYTLSSLHNILRSCFTRMGSLWPSSCS